MNFALIGRRWSIVTIALVAAALGACGGDLEPAAPTAATAATATIDTHAALTVIDPGLTLLPSPRITSSPQNATVGLGAGVRFSVTAAGHAPFTYRWFRNGVAIAGAAGAAVTYDISAATLADSGTWMVRVADRWGSTATASAQLVVVQNGWAPLGGRVIQVTSTGQAPSLALCAQPSLARITPSTGRNALVVSYFDGKHWVPYGAGGILNATATGSAAEPALDCVNDGTAYRPIVAWTEGNANASAVFVKVWDGSAWKSVGPSALNGVAGSKAIRPTLRTTPLDANTGNTFINGTTRRSVVAWVENGVPTVRYWDNGWLPYGGGGQIPGVTGANDLALTIELDEQGRTYPPVLAWLANRNGALLQFAATHNAALNTWVPMGDPISGSSNPQTPLTPSIAAGRIGVGVGKYGQGRTPVAFWADSGSPNQFRSYLYDSANFVQGTGNQAWPRYGANFNYGAGTVIKTTSFDPREFRLEGPNACGSTGNVPTFGWAISHGTGFEVRRGACGGGLSPVDWKVVRSAHNVALEELSLRMAGANDPWVAGTQLSGGSYRLFVWKFYP